LSIDWAKTKLIGQRKDTPVQNGAAAQRTRSGDRAGCDHRGERRTSFDRCAPNGGNRGGLSPVRGVHRAGAGASADEHNCRAADLTIRRAVGSLPDMTESRRVMVWLVSQMLLLPRP